MRFLLDSTVLIDHLNGIDAAEVFLRDHAPESCISVITVNEVLAGSEPDAVGGHELLLDQFACLDVGRLTAKASAALRRAHGWKLASRSWSRGIIATSNCRCTTSSRCRTRFRSRCGASEPRGAGRPDEAGRSKAPTHLPYQAHLPHLP